MVIRMILATRSKNTATAEATCRICPYSNFVFITRGRLQSIVEISLFIVFLNPMLHARRREPRLRPCRVFPTVMYTMVIFPVVRGTPMLASVGQHRRRRR